MQYGKVEICGVNTSRLKLLSEDKKRELLHRIHSGTTEERKQARDEMINGNLRLVLSVIQRFVGRGENPDDLFQVGVIGLIKAIDNFDPELDVRFSTYGVPMIIGEIRRYLRDNNAVRVSRSMRDTAYRAMQIKEQLTARNNREPTVEEIARLMDTPKENVVLALEAVVEPVSLYEPVFSDGGDTVYVMDQIGDNNDDKNWLEEIALKEAISTLGSREKEAREAYFQDKGLALDQWKSYNDMLKGRASSRLGVMGAYGDAMNSGLGYYGDITSARISNNNSAADAYANLAGTYSNLVSQAGGRYVAPMQGYQAPTQKLY